LKRGFCASVLASASGAGGDASRREIAVAA
jgi:hypothetical protein